MYFHGIYFYTSHHPSGVMCFVRWRNAQQTTKREDSKMKMKMNSNGFQKDSKQKCKIKENYENDFFFVCLKKNKVKKRRKKNSTLTLCAYVSNLNFHDQAFFSRLVYFFLAFSLFFFFSFSSFFSSSFVVFCQHLHSFYFLLLLCTSHRVYALYHTIPPSAT